MRWLLGSVLLLMGLTLPAALQWGRWATVEGGAILAPLAVARRSPALASSLAINPVVRRASAEQVELEVSWAWSGGGAHSWFGKQDRLLAVSFDTQQLVMEQEEAPAGKGGYGPYLKQLGEVAGQDGARRLFVIPEGEDGRVRLLFRSVDPAVDPSGVPLRIYLVTGPPDGPVHVQEAAL
ncbi:MAG TPA: hypothetical protein VK191_14625 [Symbiobacteriaceae bacterium]|nr:hypothetical protein [Symbiobacteriaceae bacterium]